MASPVIELFQLSDEGTTYSAMVVLSPLAFNLNVGEYIALNEGTFRVHGIQHSPQGIRVFGKIISSDEMIQEMQARTPTA